jgi:hypothetical protein
MDKILFVIGIAIASFVYGVATVKLEIPPYQWLRQAKLGWEAWGALERDKSRFPNNFESFDEKGAPVPQAKALAKGAGDELILVTGGPYEMMDRCPTWGCMAWITDRSGKVLHTWEVNLDDLWSGMKGFSGAVNNLAMYPVGMYLGDDGSLVITFQGRDTYPIQIGIAKVDRHGKVVWKRFDNSSHWIAVDGQGLIYTPYTVYRRDAKHLGDTGVEIRCQTGEANVDRIRVLTQDGQRVREIKLVSKFIKAGYRGVFYGLRDGCDPVHLNSIDIVTPEIAKRIPNSAPGDLLISLRESSLIGLIDGKTGDVKYAMSDRTAAQHGLRFLPDGSALAFDNMGGDRELGGSRVVRLDLVKGTARTVFPRERDKALLPFFSPTAGHIDVSADGKRALVAVTHQGRVIELDIASGDPLWVYDNTHDIGKFLEANGLRSPNKLARFATYGAYYVHNVKFLKEPS